jgi:formylglycine-generating enzyme required for sulfatase activity
MPAATGAQTACEGYYRGLFDMSGNVAEWTSPCTDEHHCVAAGGGLLERGADVACSATTTWPSSMSADWLGFRCCSGAGANVDAGAPDGGDRDAGSPDVSVDAAVAPDAPADDAGRPDAPPDAAVADAPLIFDSPMEDVGPPTDAPPDTLCPAEMVSLAGWYCLDRYEASRSDAGLPVSKPGVMPWVNVTWAAALAACQAVGKNLCDDPPWTTACGGPGYPYGPLYEPFSCNGWELDAGRPLPTGAMSECEGVEPGLFDMLGNVREWVIGGPPGVRRARGGSFVDPNTYCAPETAFTDVMETDAGYADDQTGFRCCHLP